MAISRQAATIFLEGEDSSGLELASTLDLESDNVENAPDEWHLTCHDGKLALRRTDEDVFMLPYEDLRHRIENARSSTIAKACASERRPRVFDALGGWGLDAIVLSEAGCRLTFAEANPIVCAVAKNLAMEACTKVAFIQGLAEDYLNEVHERFDVIYLDPLFPEHPKGARPVRRMQILQQLAKTDTDLHALFELARNHAFNRVVVKHRRNQPSLFGVPDWQIAGKTVRFDVYRSNA